VTPVWLILASDALLILAVAAALAVGPQGLLTEEWRAAELAADAVAGLAGRRRGVLGRLAGRRRPLVRDP
jgi:hypothetical protein